MPPRRPARSRPARHELLDSSADRLRQDDVGSQAELAVLHRAGTELGGPANLLAPRSGARRFERVNGLIVVRGQSQDYDRWRDLGNPGWGWDDVLPYFIKLESNSEFDEDQLHGTAGPLRVTGIGRRHELVEAFIAAAESCGVPRTADFNGATQEGAGYYQLTTRNGWRVSAADAYLREAKRRNNLEIFTGAHVARVIVENCRATGVVCRIGTQLRELHAKRGVILAAGAVQSPQLLMRSGIGPSEHLRAYGIPVVIDRRRSDATCRTISRCD